MFFPPSKFLKGGHRARPYILFNGFSPITPIRIYILTDFAIKCNLLGEKSINVI